MFPGKEGNTVLGSFVVLRGCGGGLSQGSVSSSGQEQVEQVVKGDGSGW